MTQQVSVKSYFPAKKRPFVEDIKNASNPAKVLLLDSTYSSSDKLLDDEHHKQKIIHITPVEDKQEKKLVKFPHIHHSGSGSATKARVKKRLDFPVDEAVLKSSNFLKSFLKSSQSKQGSTNTFLEDASVTPDQDNSCVAKNGASELHNPSTSYVAEETDFKVPKNPDTPQSKEVGRTENPSTPASVSTPEKSNLKDAEQEIVERPSTPVNSPSLEEAVIGDLGLNDLKVKINRSKRYNALKDSLQRYHSREARLKEIASRLKSPPSKESQKVQEFSSFEFEVPVSPTKSPLKPQRLFSSPAKSPRKLMTVPDFVNPPRSVYISPRKLLEDAPSPVKAIPCHAKFESLVNGTALNLPFKYRSLFEIFCAVDTISSMFNNRNEKITFAKLKSGVQEMLRRNFSEQHLGQIKTVMPNAFEFSQEKYQIFGKRENADYHLIIKPVFGENKSEQNDCKKLMTPAILASRKHSFNKSLLEITKLHHKKYLLSLDPPLDIPTDKLTRWHAEFDVNAVPDIPVAEIPKSPAQIKQTSAKDVLENARSLLKGNVRVVAALDALSEKHGSGAPGAETTTATTTITQPLSSSRIPSSSSNLSRGSATEAINAVTKALKGVPKSFLDKIKAKQAARAVEALTRSPAQNKKSIMLSRLPEIARILRNLFVVERKSVLPLNQVTVKLQHSFRESLTPTEVKTHLGLIQEHAPEWLSLCIVRNMDYVKLLRTADPKSVMEKLEKVAENEGRIFHCR